MRVLLTTIGSRGDVQPMCALAQGLVARGHDVGLCAPPGNERWAARVGATFWPAGRDIQAYLNDKMAEGMNTLTNGPVLRRLFLEEVPKQVAATLEAAESFRPDLMTMAGLSFAATTAAERVGAPSVWFPYTPGMFPSDEHAPAIMPIADKPAWVNRLFWRLNAWIFRRWVEEPLSRLRADLDMSPYTTTYSSLPEHVICAWDEPLAGPAVREAPAGDRVLRPGAPTGHLDFDHSGDRLDDALSAFLDAGEPPVYLGFGSMPDTHPERTARAAIDATRALGKRLVILTGWSRRAELEHDDQVFVGENAPHTALFPRCSVLIHHGGAGTTATSGRAGKPQVIVPHIVDQFDWSSRLHARGLAPRRVPKSRLNAARLGRAIERALDPQMQARAAEVGDELREIDGVAGACDALERISAS